MNYTDWAFSVESVCFAFLYYAFITYCIWFGNICWRFLHLWGIIDLKFSFLVISFSGLGISVILASFYKMIWKLFPHLFVYIFPPLFFSCSVSALVIFVDLSAGLLFVSLSVSSLLMSSTKAFWILLLHISYFVLQMDSFSIFVQPLQFLYRIFAIWSWVLFIGSIWAFINIYNYF